MLSGGGSAAAVGDGAVNPHARNSGRDATSIPC